MATNKLRIPPQSVESEMALLGSVMLRPESINEVLDIIHPESFYSDRHRKIFETMIELLSKSTPIDLVSLSSRLKEKKVLDQVGGKSYLSEIIESVPSSANIVHYANIVAKKATARNLINAAEEIGAMSYDEIHELDVLLDEAEKRIFKVTNKTSKKSFIELKDTLGDAWERIDKLHKTKDSLRGVPTGFKCLDTKLAGFQKSDLVILAARPSMGKTSLALDIARHAAVEYKVPTLIFSLEMSAQQLIDRMLAAQAQVDAWKLRTGKLTNEEDFNRIRDSLDVLSNAPIFVDDKPGNNALSMRSTARRLKSEKELGLIIVDYLQLMTPTNLKSSENMVQQVTEISRSLKSLARELDIPVIALSQLSRAVEQRGGKPRLSDLRDSGSIEQDADVVMFIHRDDKYHENSDKPNIAEILIEKHRNGPTGRVELYFDEKKSTFIEIDAADHGQMPDLDDN
ncbi:MAG TPA: replicative DNA helicase [Candidatus Paceibacterota bacterium]|nr:replicative DNA helicase [Candidatus Paceibacterota bacterium]HRZ34571.1 replicative DNA helicase [Candidatus Paceibacterota bacterium]